MSRTLKSTLGIELLENRLVPSTISGTVFDDLNNTGILVAGEQGIPGSSVQLYNAAGTLINSTTTDANGNYSFSTDNTINAAPTTQEVDAVFATQTTNWSSSQAVAQFNPALGTLTGVDIISNAVLTSDIKVQSLDSAPSTATGQVSGEITLNVPGTNIGPIVTDIATDESIDLPAYDGAPLFQGARHRLQFDRP
jgi:hypothetical protein